MFEGNQNDFQLHIFQTDNAMLCIYMLMYWKWEVLFQDILLINILVLLVLGRLCLKLIQFHFFKGGRFFITLSVCVVTQIVIFGRGEGKAVIS